MSELTDFIKAYPPDRLAIDLRADPAFELLNLLWVSPKELAPMCDDMGWQTVDDVVAWVGGVSSAIGNTKEFISRVAPSVDFDVHGMADIPWHDIHVALSLQTTLAADLKIHQSDAHYRLPTRAQWVELASKCPVSRRPHSRNELMDCDDFAKAFIGWLASIGLGNCAAGFVGTRHYRDALITGGHALVAVLDNTKTVWMIEPQTGVLHAPSESARLGGNWLANRLEVAIAIF